MKKIILTLLLALTVSAAANTTCEPSLSSYQLQDLVAARLVEAAKNWKYGNVRHEYVAYNHHVVPAVLLYRGEKLVGYVAFRPGAAGKPIAILPNELPQPVSQQDVF